MSTTAKENSKPAAEQPQEPMDVVDGIPDRSSRPRAWKYVLLTAIFLAWVAFLIYCWRV